MSPCSNLRFRDANYLMKAVLILLLLFAQDHTIYTQVLTRWTPFTTTQTVVSTSDGLGSAYNITTQNQAMILADFDNDGDKDVVYSSSVTDYVTSFAENLGGGNFAPPPAAPVVLNLFNFGLPVDINKDGNMDIIGISYAADRCIYQTGNGDGTFNAQVILKSDVRGLTLDTADYTGDGFADVVLGSAGISFTNQAVEIYASAPGGPVLSHSIFVPGTIASNYSDPDVDNRYETATGDYNSDGFTDVAIVKYPTSSSYSTNYYVALNNGVGGFLAPMSITMPSSAYTNYVTNLKIADYDEDGSKELVVLTAFVLCTEDEQLTTFNRGVSLKVLDFNQDGKDDFMVMQHGTHPHVSSGITGVSRSVNWMENIGNGVYDKRQVVNLNGNTSFSAEYFDFDQDGYYDILSRPRSPLPPNSLYWHKGDWKLEYKASGKVWYDVNQNDTFDAGEVGFGNAPITKNGSQVSLTSNGGNFAFWTDTLDQVLSVNPPPGWSISTDSLSYLADYNNGTIIPDQFNFGLFPDSIFPQGSINAFGGGSIRCDSIGYFYLSVNSYGSEASSVQLQYTLDTLLTLNATSFVPDSIVGQTIYWTVNSSWINQPNIGFWISVNSPGAASAGDLVFNDYTGIFYDAQGVIYQVLSDNVSRVIRCSYDPNDKQVEPAGFLADRTFVPLGQEKTYRIRFQNTGNDTAYNVMVEDIIRGYLNQSTLQVVSASHPYSVTMIGSTVQFYFDNVNLLPSTQNYDLSQGYIEFRIEQIDSSHSLLNNFVNPPYTSVSYNNSANIYFDYNDPITTNNVINKLYSCDTVKFSILPPYVDFLFPGDTLFATNNEIYIDLFEWKIDGVVVSNDSLLVWPSWADSIGTYSVSLATTNKICTKESYKPIELIPKHIIEQTDTICALDSLFVGGAYQTTSGIYSDTLTNQFGYDSIVITTLTVLPLLQTFISPIVCDTYTSPSGNYVWTTSGNYVDTIAGLFCDTIYQINLTVSSTSTIDIQSACDSYTWIDGITYTTSNNTATVILTNAAGCDSIITLNLSMNYSSAGIDTHVACNSFTWIDGNTYTASNNTATAILTNSSGCDSIVTLNLTLSSSTSGIDVYTACELFTWIDGNTYTSSNNTATITLTNASGCDSIVTLNLTIIPSTYGTDVQSACLSYTWIDGNTYTASNNSATYVLTNAVGCDSIVTLDLTIIPSTYGTDVQSACVSYTWIDGNTYTTSNNSATYVLTNAVGCDSIVTLDLTIHPVTFGTDVQTACNSFTWIDGNTYTSSTNSPTFVLTNTAGCDSLVTLNLTINYSSAGIDTHVACNSFTWIDGNTYTSSTNSPTFVLTNTAGCDSLVTLNLTINYSSAGIDTHVACNSFTWIDGTTYTSSTNSPTFVLTNTAGCDSLVTLNLTIISSSSSVDTHVACDSFTWMDGITYATSNSTSTYILVNSMGCDSIITLNLTINESSPITILNVQECEEYTSPSGNYVWSNSGIYYDTLQNVFGCDSVLMVSLTIQDIDLNVINVDNTLLSLQSNAFYQWVDCSNSSPIIGENSQTFTPSSAGQYSVKIDYNGCTDTSECVSSSVGINQHSIDLEVLVYPNPNNGLIHIELGENYPVVKASLVNAQGQIVQSATYRNQSIMTLNIDAESGWYILTLEVEERKAKIPIFKI